MPQHHLGILVGGGPAPGINGVISAATIEAINHGWSVTGIMDGFKGLAGVEELQTMPLHINEVSRIHQRGGSILRTSRENPTKDAGKMQKVRQSLLKLGIDRLITIGGDDTLYTASVLAQQTKAEVSIIHVPKTIDNDLPLPDNRSTFGFQTARHYGVEIVQNIMEDAMTTNRWYFVVTMGRKAGHLALGISKAAGATLAIIAEEFPEKVITLARVSDILEGAIIKRLAMGKTHGVAVLSEGIAERFDTRDPALRHAERDEHDHLRLSEIDLGKILRNEVKRRLEARGIKITIVDKDIGYELRCAAPIPFDAEYTRDLGYGAAKLLRQGVSEAMVSIQGGQVVPVPFANFLDPTTGRMKIRYVDVTTESYAVARSYMIRLEKEDFTDPAQLARLADVARTTPEEFRRQFVFGT